MEKEDIVAIAEGLRLIESGVMKIQGVMRSRNIKSLQEVAAELIPLFKQDDDALSETVVKHLDAGQPRKKAKTAAGKKTR